MTAEPAALGRDCRRVGTKKGGSGDFGKGGFLPGAEEEVLGQDFVGEVDLPDERVAC